MHTNSQTTADVADDAAALGQLDALGVSNPPVPALRRAPSSTSTAPHSASLEGVFSFGVCDFLDSVYDVGRLARISKAMLAEVQSMERTWMRACLEACAGFGGSWIDFTKGKGARIYEGGHVSWYRAFGAVLSCRDELINGDIYSGLWGPSMAQHADGNNDRCMALKWGDDEVWTRAPPSPPERLLREAWAHLTMQSTSLMKADGDDQCSTFPVFCALYKRQKGTSGDFDLPEARNEAQTLAPEDFQGKVKGLFASLILEGVSGHANLCFAAPNCSLEQAEPSELLRADKPVSVETMLEAIRDTLQKGCRVREDSLEDDGIGNIEDSTVCELDFARANSVRLARLQSFASLCTGGGGHASLSPSEALALARDALGEAYGKWAGNYEEDTQLDAEETIEGCLLRLVSEELSESAPEVLARFEAMLALELTAQEESVCKSKGHGTIVLRRDDPDLQEMGQKGCDVCGWGTGDEPSLDDKFPFFYHCAEEDWDACCECGAEPRWSASHINARADALIQQVLDALRAQILALAPNASLTAPTVVPLALSDADFMPEALFGRFDNDHEGHLCYACVAEEWVTMVGVKVSAC